MGTSKVRIIIVHEIAVDSEAIVGLLNFIVRENFGIYRFLKLHEGRASEIENEIIVFVKDLGHELEDKDFSPVDRKVRVDDKTVMDCVRV